MIQYNKLKMVFSSHQYQHNHKLAGLGSGGQLIAPRWLHILQHCYTISQLIYQAVVVDTTIVHVRQIANTGLVTPHLDAEGMFAYDRPRTMKAAGQTVSSLLSFWALVPAGC